MKGKERKMKIKYLRLIIIILIMIFMIGCAKRTKSNISDNSNIDITPTQIATEPPISKMNEIEVDYSNYFKGTEGTAVFYNKNEKSYYVYNKGLSEKQSSPCSSFKIVSCLLGLESGAINPEDSIQKWNGTIYSIKEWNKDINYIDAFHYSCIWYFREVLNLVGADYVQNALNKLEYGNCDISEWEGSRRNMIFPEQQDLSELNGFWQESSLQISPREQVEVQKRIFEDNDIFSMENIELIKNVMHIDHSNPEIQIYGKTGSGIKDDTWNDGWFVGMCEINENTYYFAIRLNQPGKRGNDAKEIAVSIINHELNKRIN
jgi:bla regulator protein BlaR1